MAESLPAWRYLAASVIGTSHVAQNLPCQDAHAVAILDDGTLIVAVADGAGSAKRAEIGARRAVDASIRCLTDMLQESPPSSAEQCESLLERAVAHARSALQDIDQGDGFNELATTLLLAIVTQRWLSTTQIGDGAVVSRAADGSLRVLSQPSDGEYINETTFLTSSDCLNRLHTETVPSEGVNGLAMLSDGIQLLALRYADNTAHGPFFHPLFEFAANSASTSAELEEFLNSERVCERTDDDKTLVLAVRHDAF